MARLGNLRPQIGTLKCKLGYASSDQRGRSRFRDAAAPWRAWYKTARWQKLRLRILLRDNYTCQITGALLVGAHPAPDSPVVDHIRPHRGDPALFWAEDNLHAVSKEWHDSEKQRQEHAAAGDW